jgi:hypothetical protein
MPRPQSTPARVLFDVAMIGYPQPQLLDTSVMFSELVGVSRNGRSRLLAAAENGSAILYLPANVAKEIPEKVPRIANAAKVPVEVVEVAWRERYAPSVRVIDAPAAPADLRRADLEAVDADDLAFADAVALMGPILALSEDRHLTSRGLATDQWRDLPQLIEALKTADITLKVTPEATALIISETAKAARRHPRIAAALALLAFLVAGPFGPERTRLSGDRARAFARQVLQGLLYLLETRSNSSHVIASRLVPGTAEVSLRAVVAVLARLSEPISQDLLAARLGREVDPDDLPAILAGCSAIIETPEGWQLGRPVF